MRRNDTTLAHCREWLPYNVSHGRRVHLYKSRVFPQKSPKTFEEIRLLQAQSEEY